MQPHFDYCILVWGNCTKTLSTKLQKLQNRAARIITYSSYDVNADLLIEKLAWRKLDSQRVKSIRLLWSLNRSMVLLPIISEKHLLSIVALPTTLYSLRDTESKLAIPLPRTNFMKNSFSYSGAVLWNSLPAELRQTNSLRAFRSGCKNYSPLFTLD